MAELDMEFHKLLGEITKNRLVKKLYSFIMGFFAPTVQESHRNQGFNAERAIQVHEHLLAALNARDLNFSADAVKDSVETWENLIHKSLVNK